MGRQKGRPITIANGLFCHIPRGGNVSLQSNRQSREFGGKLTNLFFEDSGKSVYYMVLGQYPFSSTVAVQFSW